MIPLLSLFQSSPVPIPEGVDPTLAWLFAGVAVALKYGSQFVIDLIREIQSRKQDEEDEANGRPPRRDHSMDRLLEDIKKLLELGAKGLERQDKKLDQFAAKSAQQGRRLEEVHEYLGARPFQGPTFPVVVEGLKKSIDNLAKKVEQLEVAECPMMEDSGPRARRTGIGWPRPGVRGGETRDEEDPEGEK